MISLKELARHTKAELVGDPDAVVDRAAPFHLAQEGDVTFAAHAELLSALPDSKATAIIVGSRIEATEKNLLVVPNPKLAFARALHLLHSSPYIAGGVSDDLRIGEGSRIGLDATIHPRVTIGRDTGIGNRVTLHPGVVIGNRCQVGDDATLYPNVTLYDDCRIGRRAIVHSGTVIGADGFGFVADEEGRQVKMLQTGRVIVEDDCEIGANCAIDRGLTDTILRRGVKLDNLIQVGHNCEIGEDTIVVAQSGFSGGTRIGRRCVIAGQVGTVHQVTVGDGAVLLARAVVTKNIRPGAQVGGLIPAREVGEWKKSQALYAKLPEIMDRLKRIEEIIRERGLEDEKPGSE
jgi:UDP-3-O-[3-hydroxymyristoyl] glucosamine N-acyltransferase